MQVRVFQNTIPAKMNRGSCECVYLYKLNEYEFFFCEWHTFLIPQVPIVTMICGICELLSDKRRAVGHLNLLKDSVIMTVVEFDTFFAMS